MPEEVVAPMVLTDLSPVGLLGYQFLHFGFLHLFGNMLLLWVFGNAVCGVINSLAYVGIYLALGIAAGATHLLLDGAPAVGASGSLCGIMGLYLAIYPRNDVYCFWWFMIRAGTFNISGWLLIAFWFAADLLGAFSDSGGVAHWAHIGGTVTGFVTGILLLHFRLIDIFDYDNPTVLDLLQKDP
jgi:membrane associated rhomboid family serine protease